MHAPLDHLDIERFSPLGDTAVVVLGTGSSAAHYRSAHALIVGVDEAGILPSLAEEDFDILLTTAAKAPRPWLSVAPQALKARVATLKAAVLQVPHAAAALRQVLRTTQGLSFEHALTVESFAYSTLLGGEEFRRWRSATARNATRMAAPSSVTYARDGDHVTLTLSQADTRNAMSAAMRDALHEALAAVLDDPSAPRVTLRGEGACFSVGGELDEFGSNADLSAAHAIRTLRSVAKLIHELGDRIEVVFHGACIGSGLEAPAAAAHRLAVAGAFFQLPELKMGLIPGAGGAVTIPRAIGRHRACAMMLGGARVSAATAHEWGLVSAIMARP